MQKMVGSEEARRRLPELLDKAHEGEITIITRRGKPCAAIVPVDQLRISAISQSFIQLLGTGAGLWSEDPAAYIEKLREEWT